MALDMRALYYVTLPEAGGAESEREYEEAVKANENFLNQNFDTIKNKLAELEARLCALE